jgi:alpha-N-arabinofuranosidase
MEMYAVHQDATYIPLELKSTQYVLGKERLPAISASASKDSTGRVHLSVVNIDAKQQQQITVTLPDIFSSVTGRVLSSQNVSDHNTFAAPEKIKPSEYKDASLKSNTISMRIPPFSVVVLELSTK